MRNEAPERVALEVCYVTSSNASGQIVTGTAIPLLLSPSARQQIRFSADINTINRSWSKVCDVTPLATHRNFKGTPESAERAPVIRLM